MAEEGKALAITIRGGRTYRVGGTYVGAQGIAYIESITLDGDDYVVRDVVSCEVRVPVSDVVDKIEMS